MEEEPKYSSFDPPPLFSPYVYIPVRDGQLIYRPQGYTTKLSSSMVADYDAVCLALAVARKYNITVTWRRVLEVLVHEAKDLERIPGIFGQGVRCKVVVGDEIQRTEVVDCTADKGCTWNQTLKFHVGDPCNINILAYCLNSPLPNDILGRISIPPPKLNERGTVHQWFPLGEKSQIKLSLSLSQPEIVPFKFVFHYLLDATKHIIRDDAGKKIFTITGQWPQSLTICDESTANIDSFNIHKVEFNSREKVFDILVGWGDDKQKITLVSYGDHEFEVKGLVGTERITSDDTGFALYSADCTAAGSSKMRRVFYFAPGSAAILSIYYDFEVRPGPHVQFVLAVMFLIAKLRHTNSSKDPHNHTLQ